MSDYTLEKDQPQILGHPVGLFVLFFTEMWERFSYYGMRALLILFLVAKIDDEGWGWSRGEAYALYGWYVMLVYFMPLLGGWLADNKWGHVKTVIVGASIITLGHASMAVSDLQMGIDLKFVFYLGLFLIVLGTGLFKPNMSSIVGKMYPPQSDKKDGAYTIFYMGVNSGAFIGTLLVGWIGETFSWTWGFGLAGIFMLFGLLQFYFAREVFGKAASEPKPKAANLTKEEKDQDVPFTKRDLTIASIGGFLAISWIIDGLYSVVTRGKHFLAENLFSFEAFGATLSVDMSTLFFLLSLVVFIILGVSRLKRFQIIERDRLKVVFIIAFFVIFFWASFEQAGTTMNIFARDYTNRTLVGNWGFFYKIIDFILSIAPMLVLTWVIYKLGKAIIKKYPLTILFTSISFVIIWGLVLFRVYDKLTGTSAIVDTSWFQILNPVFIISLAPLYSKIWEKYKFSGPQKFFGGLTLLAAGFGILAIGASSIPPGAETASVSMIWLLMAYLLHTMGELAVSPVGLSYVSKLAPARMLGFLFGIWYVFTGLAGKSASIMAEYSDGIAENIGLSGFFLIFTIIPFIAGLVMLSLNKPIKRMMHGIDK
ncbi:MAG: peptide MFS transporter [Flavobacteriaceae bacterium]|nr:peptide MFS transporter [Flavobacteriaceae bacterium]